MVDLIHHDEGVVKVTYGNGFTPIYSYEYFLKDHLGNTRVAFKRGSGETAIALQRSDYYSFGLRTMPYNPESDNKYLYNGKELQDETGWYDYGARMYDPALGRFHTVDPLAFKYSALSPYCYVGNRPTVAIDPDGREIVIVGPNKAQTYNDLAIIYATPMGRQMIEALHNSSNVYKIGGGGWFPTSSSYSPFWNRATYYQGDAEVRGNKYRSFEMLGHELYHAYQDETGNIKGRSKFSVEKEAVKFENYLRKIYSDGAGSQRLKYGGEELFGILEPTSFNTGGEKRDANTAKSYVQVNGGLGEAKQEGNEDEGTAKQDNTRVVLNANTFQRIFEYMENNNLQRVTIDF
ncbi:hypothetical protein JCM15548_14687 [Geofilum rubicundum JCM 15548]|uniref:RHS repeat-associated core domain-containing protein n=1 Tax=Geofilum rubicundum JCM 15548 TaxID=1236989 RepID=A0A0E9LQD9_9BACT|nr:hypothetical protein JCM15548_14687 [Geofilum rubicundum JCM 15548]